MYGNYFEQVRKSRKPAVHIASNPVEFRRRIFLNRRADGLLKIKISQNTSVYYRYVRWQLVSTYKVIIRP